MKPLNSARWVSLPSTTGIQGSPLSPRDIRAGSVSTPRRQFHASLQPAYQGSGFRSIHFRNSLFGLGSGPAPETAARNQAVSIFPVRPHLRNEHERWIYGELSGGCDGSRPSVVDFDVLKDWTPDEPYIGLVRNMCDYSKANSEPTLFDISDFNFRHHFEQRAHVLPRPNHRETNFFENTRLEELGGPSFSCTGFELAYLMEHEQGKAEPLSILRKADGPDVWEELPAELFRDRYEAARSAVDAHGIESEQAQAAIQLLQKLTGHKPPDDWVRDL